VRQWNTGMQDRWWSIYLAQYAPVFAENGIEIDFLVDLNDHFQTLCCKKKSACIVANILLSSLDESQCNITNAR